MTWLAVAAGGALGSMARHWVNLEFAHRYARTFIFVGILGGFTTFSSFMLDTFTLGHGSEPVAAS